MKPQLWMKPSHVVAERRVASPPVGRGVYAHNAVVVIRPGGSANAPGGAITTALCGHRDHRPPCPLAAHHVSSHTAGDDVTLRVLFATEPANEQHVRRLIGDALAAGELTGPDGRVTTWQLRSTAASRVRPSEGDHAAALSAHAGRTCPSGSTSISRI